MTDYHSDPMVRAECLTCDKVWVTANAHGVGVIHARKYNHEVVVEVAMLYRYNSTKEK